MICIRLFALIRKDQGMGRDVKASFKKDGCWGFFCFAYQHLENGGNIMERIDRTLDIGLRNWNGFGSIMKIMICGEWLEFIGMEIT